MAEAPDPFEAYLKRATDLFEAGDIVRAGQIWQAILKKVPDHQVARAGLYRVKLYFDSRATQDGLVQAEVAGATANHQQAFEVDKWIRKKRVALKGLETGDDFRIRFLAGSAGDLILFGLKGS